MSNIDIDHSVISMWISAGLSKADGTGGDWRASAVAGPEVVIVDMVGRRFEAGASPDSDDQVLAGVPTLSRTITGIRRSSLFW